MRFGECPTPPAPDYNNIDNWAAHPDKKDPADEVPKNLAVKENLQTADVFCRFSEFRRHQS